MPVTPATLSLISSVNGFGLYRYDTLDANATVDNVDYFNNITHGLNLAVGDIIEVVTWATAVRTGTISDVSRHIVMAVGAVTPGAVNLSTDMTSWAPVSGD